MRTLTMFLTAFGISMAILVSCSKNETPNPPAPLNKVAWAVGTSDTNSVGVILYSADGGDTWVRQGDPGMFKNIGFMDVWALDDKNVWVIGSRNKIFRSLDGGNSWIAVVAPPHPANPDLSSICILNNTDIWISGDHGGVFHTTSGGSYWEMFDTTFFHSGMMQGIWAVTPGLVYVAGHYKTGKNERGFLAVTYDGGLSWDSIILTDNFNKWQWIGMRATGAQNVMVYGQMGHYARSYDNGATWHNDSLQSGDINHLIMLSPTEFWGAFDFDQIYKTSDGGINWILQNSPPPSNYYLVGIDAWSSQEALAVGQSQSSAMGKIIKTTDGGTTWVLKDTVSSHLWKVSYAKY